MRFTLTQAAKEAGVSKGTISKALKSGRMSGERQEDGSFQIEPVELFRVFPKKHQELQAGTDRKPRETVANRPETDTVVTVEVAVLRARVELLERERETILSAHQETIADLRKRLDAEQEERRALQRQLMPPAAERVQDRPVEVLEREENAAKVSKGFLGRIMSW